MALNHVLSGADINAVNAKQQHLKLLIGAGTVRRRPGAAGGSPARARQDGAAGYHQTVESRFAISSSGRV